MSGYLMSAKDESSFLDEILRQKKGRSLGKFNPNRRQINEAVEEYLRNGGKIRHTEVNDETFENFVSIIDTRAVDTFLMGIH